LDFCVGGPGAEFISAKGTGETVDNRLAEKGRVEAMEEDVEFCTHDLLGRQERQYHFSCGRCVPRWSLAR